MGQFKVLPMYCTSLSACKTAESARVATQVPGSAVGSPGYFSISLAPGIKVRVWVATSSTTFKHMIRPKSPSQNTPHFIVSTFLM